MRHVERSILQEFLSATRHAVIALLFILSLSAVQGCDGRDDPSTSSSSSDSSSSPSSSAAGSSSTAAPTDLSYVHGRILDIAGRPINKVNIAVYQNDMASPISMSSAVDGTFHLELEAATSYVFHIRADDFADQVVPVESPDTDGQVFIEATLIARAGPITIGDSGVLTHTGAAGAAVTVDKADFVDANGVPVTGDVQLTITPVDVSNPASVAAFPGSFAGVPEGAAEATPIVSLGVVEYEFFVNGESVNLAPSASAEILIPVYVAAYPDGSPIKVGDTIPLWSLNENTGLWTQEGDGTIVVSNDSPTGLAFSATVTHFSWWNCDVAPQTARAQVAVLGEGAGNATTVANAPELVNWRGDTASTTIRVGETTNPLYIPAGLEVCFTADLVYDDESFSTTDEVCLTANPNELVDVILLAGEDGPLDIMPKPSDEEEDTVTISALTDMAIPPVALFPLTAETAVDYVVTAGTLPQGLSLDIFGTRARIVGVPTEAGEFSFTVTATDSDGFADEVLLNYAIAAFNPLTQILLPFDQSKCTSSNSSPRADVFFSFSSGEAVIDWGDGSQPETFSFSESPTGSIHIYSDTYRAIPVITFSDGIGALTSLDLGGPHSNASCLVFDLSDMKNARSLKKIEVYGNNRITGNVRDLPRGLTQLMIFAGDNVVEGDLKDLPRSLLEVSLWGNTTIQGNVKDLPRSLTHVDITGSNEVVGDVVDLPRSLRSSLYITGKNKLRGNVRDLPRSLENRLQLMGSNVISGDIADMPESLQRILVHGENTLSGNIHSIPEGVVSLDLRGANTVGGDLGLIKAHGISTLQVGGANTINEFSTFPSWTPINLSMLYLFHKDTSSEKGLEADEIDRLLILISETTGREFGSVIIDRPGDASPTEAADSAISALEEKGFTVRTN